MPFQGKMFRSLLRATCAFFGFIGFIAVVWLLVETMLFRAASGGDLRAMNLLGWAIRLQPRDFRGETPLMYAAATGQSEAAALIVRSGAVINALSHDGESALAHAVRGGHVRTVQVLLENGANPNIGNGGPIHYAATFQDTTMLKLLISGGADVNVRDGCGATPLIHALIHDRSPEIVEILLDAGATVNVKSCDGKSPLQLARETRTIESLRRLGAQ